MQALQSAEMQSPVPHTRFAQETGHTPDFEAFGQQNPPVVEDLLAGRHGMVNDDPIDAINPETGESFYPASPEMDYMSQEMGPEAMEPEMGPPQPGTPEFYEWLMNRVG